MHPDSDADLHTRALDLRLPDGKPLLTGASFRLEPRRWILVSGPNGVGKSTLFRAIAGIWPFGRGVIHVPPIARLLFLPQRPYVPVGSLRDAVSYPDPADRFGDLQVGEVLRAVGLTRFVDGLHDAQNWGSQMSGGEQQRLALARAILHQPDWLFLDEATSALDEASDREMYELIRRRLPTATIVSIAHRSEIARYHPLRLVFATPHGDGTFTLVLCDDTAEAAGCAEGVAEITEDRSGRDSSPCPTQR